MAAGRTREGLGRIIAMMFSRYHGGAGTFRSASDFDFFRGVHFDKSIPALYDDGETGSEPIKKKKAFSDVGDTETILKERWTAAKFVMHQLRVILDNQYDPSAEPEDGGQHPARHFHEDGEACNRVHRRGGRHGHLEACGLHRLL